MIGGMSCQIVLSMKEHQLFLVNTGDIQSNKSNKYYLSTFDASVDNIDIVTYNNLERTFSPVWFPLLRTESSRAIVISPSSQAIAFDDTQSMNLMKRNHLCLMVRMTIDAI